MLPLLAILCTQTQDPSCAELLARHARSWSGVALVLVEGRTLFAGGFGFADFESNRPNDAHTRFDVGPLTEVLTAVAAERLAQSERLELDDSIAVYLAGVPEPSAGITVRQLLAHTSGIQAGRADPGADEVRQTVQLLGSGPTIAPGTRCEHWSGGYALLARVLEHAGGEPFEELLQHEVLGPAGMATAGWAESPLPPELSARGRTSTGALRRAHEPFPAVRGAEGLVLAVSDLEAWYRALDSGALLDAVHRTDLFTPVRDGCAPGWRLARGMDGRPRLSAGGTAPGFVSELRILPERDACLAVLANDERADVLAIADNLECLLAGRTLPAPPPRDALPDDEGAACAGSYVSTLGRIVVRAAPGVLEAGLEGRELLALAGAGETLDWPADHAALEKAAFAIVDGLAHTDTGPLREHMAPRLPRSWPDTVRSQVWPAFVELHGAYRGCRPLGSLARADRVEVLLVLDHELGPARVVVVFGPAGLEELRWDGPEFPATARLERVRRGTWRLLVDGGPRELRFALGEGRAPSLRLEGRELVRAGD